MILIDTTPTTRLAVVNTFLNSNANVIEATIASKDDQPVPTNISSGAGHFLLKSSAKSNEVVSNDIPYKPTYRRERSTIVSLREGLHPTFNPKTFSPKKQLPAWL
jgi:hypothetical protein